ncbi:hypothetical protein BK025_08845 [Sodalis sp. TME1]|nr:hypothetical protein BK025_08845 [Sodalis sp. TME1]
MKINKPKVLIHKRQHHDSYAIAITHDSDDFHDGLLIVSAEPNGLDEDYDAWVIAAYYMAAELEKCRGGRGS